MEHLKKRLRQYALFDLPEHKFKEAALYLSENLFEVCIRWSEVQEIGKSPDGVYVMVAADWFAPVPAEKYEHFKEYFWM